VRSGWDACETIQWGVPHLVADEVAAGLWSRRYRSLTAGLVLTVVLTAFEILAVATVMPIVVPELGGLELYGWAVSAFFLGSLLGTVVVGGILDRRGLLGAFLGSLILFGVGLALAGTAVSMPMLVVARFIQGVGGGALTPVSYVAIGRGLPEALRPRMFALMSTAWIVPAVLGPAAAGLIAEAITWRAVFLGLLPFLVIAGVLTAGAMARVQGATPPGQAGPAGRGAADGRARSAIVVTVGAALFTAGLSMETGLDLGGFEVPVVVVQAAVTLLGLALVGVAFRRLTPPGTLRLARGLPAAILSRGVLTIGFYALDAYVALALIQWRGLSAGVAGLALAGGSLCWTLGSWTQARWALRRGYAFFVRAGFAALITGIAGFALALDPGVPVALSFAAFALAGLGMGLAYAPQSLIVLREAAHQEQGAATSALNLADLLGTALGIGLTGAVLAAGLRSGASVGAALLPAFLLGALATAGGLLLSGRLGPAGEAAGAGGAGGTGDSTPGLA
jgi:MFS family permease